MLLDKTVAMVDGNNGGRGRNWRVRRRTWSATSAAIPAAVAVVVAGWADSSYDGGMVHGQDAFADRNVGKSAAIHRDPATR